MTNIKTDEEDYTTPLRPDEVVEIIKLMGIKKTSKRTVHEWTRAGLIPAPRKVSEGRKTGVHAEYPATTPAQFYASWRLWHQGEEKKLTRTREDVAKIRRVALAGWDTDYIMAKFNADWEMANNIRFCADEWLNLLETGVELQTAVMRLNKKTAAAEEKVLLKNTNTQEIIEKLKLADLAEQKIKQLEAKIKKLETEKANLKAEIAQLKGDE